MDVEAGKPRRIRPLSTLLASQIAAGEVVERPASVVKELVENSIDAGATRVRVELEQGGIELIRVSDNGHGIHPEDLGLAVAPHATSKVAEPGDLERIATLGFRGEALASIGSVSRFSIRSRTAAAAGATEIQGEGDALEPARPAPGPIGTAVTVRTLFFNTPARRKFLKTVATEQTRCLDVVRDVAMAHPAIAFEAVCDGRATLDFPVSQSPRQRAIAVLGKEVEGELLEVHADQYDDARGAALWGLVGKPSLARATNRSQYVFVNGRPVRDRTVQHALGEAFRGLIEPSRYPTAVLMLEMSPEAVDVNVHPAKAEVRFRESSMVHSVVLNAVRRALRAADLTPSIPPSFNGRWEGAAAPVVIGDRAIQPQYPGAGMPASASAPSADAAQAFADFFRRQPAAQRPLSYPELRETMRSDGPGGVPSPSEPSPPMAPEPVGIVEPKPAARVLQVHKSFLVTQDEQGVVIIDQHALHERAMFEHLLERVRAGSLESQRLLTPAVVPATPAQIGKLDELRPLLGTLGIQAEPLGPRSVGVHSFPTFLFDRGVDPVPFMTDVLERAESAAFLPGDEQTLRDVLDMMACKAAVKAGDRLSEGELTTLVELRDVVERSSNCPHGRPTSVRLTIRELEKLFGRS